MTRPYAPRIVNMTLLVIASIGMYFLVSNNTSPLLAATYTSVVVVTILAFVFSKERR